MYTSIDGDLYRGTWENDTFFGRGVYVWPDGQVYTGDYVDGLRDGKGYVSHQCDAMGRYRFAKINSTIKLTFPRF